MKPLILLSVLLLNHMVFAQVAVNSNNTPPDGSAMLDVQSTTKGFLLPRMSAAERNLISSPATGLLVYQTDGATGFYFNVGTPTAPVWTLLPYNLANGWNVSGNAGTNPALNFLGTTDNQPLIIKVNGNTTGILTPTNTAFGSGSLGLNTLGANNVAIGVTAMGQNSTGSSNTAIGNLALLLNTTGNHNIAIGEYAGFTNDIGNSNIAIGKHALANIKWHDNLVAIGDSALYKIGFAPFDPANPGNGRWNTGVGSKSLANIDEGRGNTAIGFESLMSMRKGTSNVAVGFWAMRNSHPGGGEEGNVAVGAYALANGSGAFNTAIGPLAMNGTINGGENTALGRGALSSIRGSQNTALGAYAAVQFVDYNSISNSTAVGAHAYATQSNSVILGGIAGINGAQNSTRVGIGTTAPQAQLHVQSWGTTNSPHLRLHQNTDDYTRMAFTNTTTSNRWTIGGLPQATSANAKLTFYWDGLGADVLSLFGNGNGTFLGACTAAGFYTHSDQNLKRNIAPLTGSLLSLQRINGYTYYWKDENRGALQQVGLLAQEVQKLYPQLVQTDDKGVLSVNYTGLVPVLVNAVKEQQQMIEEQSRLLQKQQQMLHNLEIRLKAMEQKVQ